jgi:hypothetical protein
MVIQIYKEQYSYKNNEVLHILYVESNGLYTIAIENTETEQWFYSDVSFENLDDARKAFEQIMNDSPSNTIENI